MRKRQATKMAAPPSLFSHQPATFGSFIREQRLGAGLSRSLLSQRTGISHAMLENIEYGRVTATYSDVRALATAFGLDEQAASRARRLRRPLRSVTATLPTPGGG
jgi:transcriptional regulator with XRE-family HTH domain